MMLKDHACALADEVSAIAKEAIEECADGPAHMLVVLTLLARCRAFHLAMAVLARHELADPADTCFRSLMEHSWVFRCLSVRGEPDSDDRRKLLAQNTYSVRAQIRKLGLGAEVESRLLAQYEGHEAERFYAEAWAQAAGDQKGYDVIYRELSRHSHPNLESMESYCEKQDSDSIRIILLPRQWSVPLHLLAANRTMLDLVELVPWAITDDLRRRVASLQKQLESVYQRAIEEREQSSSQ